MDDKFFGLVQAALPNDLPPRELIKLAPVEWWKEKPYIATAYALRKCPRLDWDAYLEANPDVRESGMDACLHFLQHGVYEGRKLISSKGSGKEPEIPRPIVSIVIINYNNAHLLPKALGSVTGQTLKDIEIIVVDDCSTDKSTDVIRAFAEKDSRIRLIVNEKNSATLVARKRGVEAATGRYLMLVDSDDYLAQDACEIAAREIAKGYDMVKFGAHVLNTLGAPEEEIRSCDNICNRGEAREYFNDEIVTAIFRDRKMGWAIWSCISRLELAQRAFADLPDEYITGPDDLYGLLAIARRATSMLKINDRLYYYNFGPGVSVSLDVDKLIRYAPAKAAAILAIRKFAKKYSLNLDIEAFYQYLCADLLGKFLAASNRHDFSAIFNELAEKLGFEASLLGLYKRNSWCPASLDNFIRPLEPGVIIRRIGIFAPKLHYGGMESAILNLCRILRMENYEPVLFLEERGSRDAAYSELAHVVYLGAFAKEFDVFSNRLKSLLEAFDSRPVDAMIYFQPQRDSLAWDMLTLHHRRIPVILWYTGGFGPAVSDSATRRKAEKLFSNADAVICQSTLEELYLRTRGVNAHAIHAPARTQQYIPRNEPPARLALVARLGDPVKQTAESLKVLGEVVKKAPWVSLLLIGDFNSPDQADRFRQLTREAGLERNITITGWTEKPEFFLKDCGALLSVSAWESMALAISEAQALGLPCVIYDIPIDQTRNNPAIISVPQGDYKAAAEAALDLLEDKEKWQNLSLVATEQSRKYTPEAFAENLCAFLRDFQRSSPANRYSSRDYGALINYLSYYSDKGIGHEM